MTTATSESDRDRPTPDLVPVVHVPVPSGDCCLVPTADLLDRGRFGLWCRALQGLKPFENQAWWQTGRELFSGEVAELNRFDVNPDAVARVIAHIPQALSVFGDLNEVFERALRAGDTRIIAALIREIRKIIPRPPIPTPTMEKLLAVLADDRGARLDSGEVLSDRQEILRASQRRAKRARPRDAEPGEAEKKLLARFRALRDKTFPRAVVKVVTDGHAGHTSRFFEDLVALDDSPRLILSVRDCGPLKKGETAYPGRSIFFRG